MFVEWSRILEFEQMRWIGRERFGDGFSKLAPAARAERVSKLAGAHVSQITLHSSQRFTELLG